MTTSFSSIDILRDRVAESKNLLIQAYDEHLPITYNIGPLVRDLNHIMTIHLNEAYQAIAENLAFIMCKLQTDHSPFLRRPEEFAHDQMQITYTKLIEIFEKKRKDFIDSYIPPHDLNMPDLQPVEPGNWYKEEDVATPEENRPLARAYSSHL